MKSRKRNRPQSKLEREEGPDVADYKEQLTPEQLEKARACKSADELIELAKSEGIELNEEQLEALTGGSWISCMNETW